ncbi:hypothetical protein pb186bvf_006086 [Paramecium bursaria]
MGACQNVQQRQQEIVVGQVKKVEEIILDELKKRNSKIQLPIFVRNKHINPSLQPRQNRFLKDIEEEVIARIKQIQAEEALELQQLKEKLVEEDRKKNEIFQHEFSFNNTIVENNPHTTQNKSQFAPKKDGDTVSYKSQISKTGVSRVEQPQSPISQKRQFNKYATNTSNYASQGSQPKGQALEKMFSEIFMREKEKEKSSSQENERNSVQSCRSILKHNSNHSVYTTKTQKKQKSRKKKKVHFSNDTNFNNERKSVLPPKKKWYQF